MCMFVWSCCRRGEGYRRGEYILGFRRYPVVRVGFFVWLAFDSLASFGGILQECLFSLGYIV